jgi:adenosylcobinamide-phosphate synthase
MAGEMALELNAALAPQPATLLAALIMDVAIGDPDYRLHPVRLIGRALAGLERQLYRIGACGYLGGIALFVVLASAWTVGIGSAVIVAAQLDAWMGWTLHLFVLYSLLAFGSLLEHVWRVERALRCGDVPAARRAVGRLVGRDTNGLEATGCRRAAIESLSENFTDGVASALFWYVLAGLPGLVLFKVVSTMDSMVGYRTPRYVRFGWCGARLDDVMNFVPARVAWALVSIAAACVPGCSARKALRIGWTQHVRVPGPNAGWSEAAMAGALQRRLVGPVWMHGTLVTDTWLGDPVDAPAGTADDVSRATGIVCVAAALASAAAIASVNVWHSGW